MNKTASILLGATIGGGLGWFIGSVIVEMMILKDYKNPWEGKDYEDTEESPQEDDIERQKETNTLSNNHTKTQRVKNYTQYFEETGRPDIAELVKKYNGADTAVAEPTDVPGEDFTTPEDADVPNIMIISLEEYAGDDEFTKETLHYFENEILVDEKGTPITDVESCIGEEALASFGALSQDEDVVYVRNNEQNTMYEVVRMHKSYEVESAPRSRRLVRKQTEEKHAKPKGGSDD